MKPHVSRPVPPGQVYFVGAGPGDPELITVRGRRILESATAVLYTGSLVPEEVLTWAPADIPRISSQDMSYTEIFAFLETHGREGVCVRLHTGDPTLYSTIAPQILFLKEKGIAYEVVPGITAAFAASASLGAEYTIPGVSQNLIISRVEGRTPNPEPLENILACRHSSHVLYLSASLLDRFKQTALALGYPADTPCLIAEKVSWPEERVVRGTLETLPGLAREAGIRQTAVILFGDFLRQEPGEQSHLYSREYTQNR